MRVVRRMVSPHDRARIRRRVLVVVSVSNDVKFVILLVVIFASYFWASYRDDE